MRSTKDNSILDAYPDNKKRLPSGILPKGSLS